MQDAGMDYLSQVAPLVGGLLLGSLVIVWPCVANVTVTG